MYANFGLPLKTVLVHLHHVMTKTDLGEEPSGRTEGQLLRPLEVCKVKPSGVRTMQEGVRGAAGGKIFPSGLLLDFP